MEPRELVARHREIVVMLLALRQPDGSVRVHVTEDSAGAIRQSVDLGLATADLDTRDGWVSGVLLTTPLLAECEAIHRGTAGCVAGLTKHLTERPVTPPQPRARRGRQP